MKVLITGATGLIGTRLVEALQARGDEITVLSRNPERAASALGVEAVGWDLLAGPPPTEAVNGRDAVIHLAGEPVAQRWSQSAMTAIRDSREVGTRNLVAAIEACEQRPSTLVSSSAVGYYGKHGDDLVDEETPAGSDFLAEVCVAWEREALAAEALGLRVVLIRTGIVLDADGGALKTMLPPFKAGVGGPVAGGKQFMPWIHADDIVGMYISSIGDNSWRGPINGTAPAPATNHDFSKKLAAVLHRPSLFPVPGFVLRARYGQMAEIVTEGQRAVPTAATALGYSFEHPELSEALRSALGR